jgi:hypothetical protein
MDLLITPNHLFKGVTSQKLIPFRDDLQLYTSLNSRTISNLSLNASDLDALLGSNSALLFTNLNLKSHLDSAKEDR